MIPQQQSNRLCTCAFSLLFLQALAARSQPHFGGGPLAEEPSNCIPLAEQQHIEDLIARRGPAPKGDGIILYPFVPIAGTVWDDRFINNYVDLDPTGGILDWDCTDWTYDGHTGHDIDLRSFGEMDAGVPVFAALDGTVVVAHDWEFDRDTNKGNQPANYVVIYHGGTQ